MSKVKLFFVVAGVFFIVACEAVPGGKMTPLKQAESRLGVDIKPSEYRELDGSGETYAIFKSGEHKTLSRPDVFAPEVGRLYVSEAAPAPIKIIKHSNDIFWKVEAEPINGRTRQNGGGTSWVMSLSEPYLIGESNVEMVDDTEPRSGERPLITSIVSSIPDSSGGVDLIVMMKNPQNSKAIKYLSFDLTSYNAVGDPVSGRIGDADRFGLKLTGPIKPDGKEKKYTSQNVLYNSDVTCFKLNAVKVVFMDDRERIFSGHDLSTILHGDLPNSCAYEG
ncbi:hypothetical protein RM531_02640 [Salinisphaera sp. P385]|uniref:Lipoprotein n=1 Tax=Spectribacter acetivorans TaxID=3075603 RepID=A0ABU3B4I4_9GAMM|nr:hypothetical protein [Salinisphaera sp. P385]MDT0617361.1 hypothetical protein [Salinisphaera sp. P385]